MRKTTTEEVTESVISLVIVCAWITHVIFCINTSKFMILIAGAVSPYIAIFHGIGVWFGVWA